MTSAYYDKLELGAKLRYKEKLTWKGEDLPDPLDLQVRLTFFTEGSRNWPDVTFGDIYVYLVETHCWYTREQFKSFKFVDGYNLFCSGKVRNISTFCTKDRDLCLIVASVEAGQTLSKFYLTWIVAEATGSIKSAHCTCMAGLGEACSHVAAVLFTIEATVKLELHKPSSTSQPCKWKQIQKEAKPAKVVNIEFSKPTVTSQKPQSTKPKRKKKCQEPSDVPVITKELLQKLMTNVKEAAGPSNLQSLFSDSEETDTASEDGSFSSLPLPPTPFVLYKHSGESDALLISLTPEQTKILENSSKQQANCQVWKNHRRGRLTASFFGRICKVQTGQENLALEIMGVSKTPEGLHSLQWGRQNEGKAIHAFQKTEGLRHKNLTVEKCGLFIDRKRPYLGASPDGIVHCDCCEDAVLEVKCPSSIKHSTIVSGCIKKTFFLDKNKKLKENHNYYFQVQGAMAITGKKRCFFVVYTTIDIEVQIIKFDHEFWNKVQKKLESFFLKEILPRIQTDIGM